MKYIILFTISAFLFSSCANEDKLSEKEVSTYIAKGKKIGKATVNELGKNLMKHMKNGGPKEAIPFCNLNANPITAEIADKFEVTIKRTSHKLRNEDNKPNIDEQKILETYLAKIGNGEKLQPIVQKDTNGKVHFYAPMKLEKKCLACHGDIKDTPTDSLIKSLYPNDNAIGFKAGDFRGILSVTFNE